VFRLWRRRHRRGWRRPATGHEPSRRGGGGGGGGSDAGGGGIQNILSGLQPGNNDNVFVVNSEDELQSLFDQLSAGGSSTQSTYPGNMVELPDGTRVGIRPTSLSGGSTIDINQPGMPIVKIHIGP
jgi:hypothetical protein